MTHLSVNINKIATLRNARGGNIPDLLKVTIDCQRFGAQGITVHPRPDERHIRYNDVTDIRPFITTELNIEGYPSEKFLKLVFLVKPHQVTLVPDPPGVLTSNAGWDTGKNMSLLKDVIAALQDKSIRTSIFIDTKLQNIEHAIDTSTNRIELYTEPYATKYHNNREEAIEPFRIAAVRAHELGLEINAGHDLNLDNLTFFVQKIPNLKEVSIGHALISDSLYFGLENTIRMYLRKIEMGQQQN
ncbi:MAG: pyridoxine 5'-phosphate synthase [Bacteroidetes bacterium]|nr:pyridoxine 5'-phosphate synthase [Bacteroidota bacterium]